MITVRECQYDEVKKFRELEGEYHYMGESHGAGDMIRLIFEEDGKWIALMTWAAACYRLKPRDMEIGWNRAMCAKRLKLIANNRRFTILNEKGARPNLGSQLLGMAMRELPAIWKAKWGYSPLLAETFCDIERTAGTCYRAAGWKAVGKTRGFSRVGHSRDFFIKNDSPKVLYMKGFTKDAWETIVANDLPDEYDVAAHSKADGILPCSPEQVDSLHWELCQVKDPRKRNKSVGIGTVLTLFTMGVAAGAHDLKSAHAYAMTLTDEQLKQVGCARKRDALGDPIEGKYVCPSYSTFHYVLAHKDKAGRHDFDVADYAAHLSKWMTAQAGKLPRHLAVDGKFIREIVGLVSLVDAESGDVVAVAPVSKKEGLKGRCELPVTQNVLAKQDLSGAVVSADALDTQDDTARIVLGQGGDYILQVKANQKSVKRQCETISRIRPLVGTSKKRAEPGPLGGTRDEGVPCGGPSRRGLPRRDDGHPHVPPDLEGRLEGKARQSRAEALREGRQADAGGRLARHVACARGSRMRGRRVRRETRASRACALVRRGVPRQARQRLPRGQADTAHGPEHHVGHDGRAIARDVGLRTKSGEVDGGDAEGLPQTSVEADANHDERRFAMT